MDTPGELNRRSTSAAASSNPSICSAMLMNFAEVLLTAGRSSLMEKINISGSVRYAGPFGYLRKDKKLLYPSHSETLARNPRAALTRRGNDSPTAPVITDELITRDHDKLSRFCFLRMNHDSVRSDPVIARCCGITKGIHCNRSNLCVFDGLFFFSRTHVRVRIALCVSTLLPIGSNPMLCHGFAIRRRILNSCFLIGNSSPTSAE